MRLLPSFGTAFLLAITVPAVSDAQATKPADSTGVPYLRRGDAVEAKYRAYRERLQSFFKALDRRFEAEAPYLRSRILPPALVPYGYQILPSLLPEPAPKPHATRVVLSRFSWLHTEGLIDRNALNLTALESRFNDSVRTGAIVRRLDHESIAAQYKKLLDAQKLMESQIQYNRFWQGEIARSPQLYENARVLEAAAIERQQLFDSVASARERSATFLIRAESLSVPIEKAIKKLPTAQFVDASHPDAHHWILSVPIYTDIEDSAFIERFRGAVERGWHVRDGDDDFSVKLDIRRLSPSQLYANGDTPAKGSHIDVVSHINRFPLNGAVLTTGSNTIYARGRAVVVGPHAVGIGALVHEFGHVLGFRDGYFRSYRDLGAEGYEIIEVILNPESVVAAPEYGIVRREHFEQVLREKQP